MLILALAFIAFFGLVTAAVLQFADAVELQQSHSSAATTADSDAEGGMLLAAQAARAAGSCQVPSAGSVTMSGGDTATYQTNACNPGATANLIADQCGACILGQPGDDQPLSVAGTLAVEGPIAVGGSVSVTGPPIKSTVLSPTGAPGFVGCYPGCGLTSTQSSPGASSLTRSPSPAVDFPGVSVPRDCPDVYDGTTGGSIPEGCYSSISVDCSNAPNGVCSYQMSGTYIVEGLMDIGGAPGVDTSVSLVAPQTAPVLLAFVPEPGGGGSLMIHADGSLSLQGEPISGMGGVLLYVDPLDTAGDLRVEGGSLSVAGTVYAPAAGLELHGGPGTGDGAVTVTPGVAAEPDSGRLIVGALDVGQYGTVNVTAAPPAPGYCWVFSDSVTVTTQGGSDDSGQVVVESDCSGEAGTRIISINYGS